MHTKRLLGLVVAMLCGQVLCAQGLPNLAKAPEIITGDLPDGISYYLIKNTASPGFADFALVQPGRDDPAGARKNLVSLPHFSGSKPYDFLASNFVGYSPWGYIQRMRGSTVFRLADVPVGESDVCDSTLLMVFDLARTSEYRQAFIISGDIDVSAITERIRILSMTISKRAEHDNDWGYSWRSSEEISVSAATALVGTISIVYRSPRTEREMMNTIQPVMSRLLASELDVILKHRLQAAFQEAGIPFADYRFRYVGSDQTSTDELFSITVFTSARKLEAALGTVAGVLSSLSGNGVTMDEVAFARTVIAETVARESVNHKMTNAEYLDKCISAYLYGSNLASNATLSNVYTGRRLDLGRERELLNRYIAGTFQPRRNLYLHAAAPEKPDASRLKEVFTEGWSAGNAAVSDIPTDRDTLLLLPPKLRKVKLKTATSDPFSGGKLWTFSNGMNVVFKKTSDKGVFYYGMMVKGGWTEIPGIDGSEPAFASEVLAMNKVAGLSASRLCDMLAMYGVTFEPQLSVSDVRFTGSAPPSSLSLVLNTLLAVTTSIEPDTDAYVRYRREKPVRQIRDRFSEDGTRSVLDSIMCPGYQFAAGSVPHLPRYDFDVRMGQYLKQKFGNMKNGVIVLMGDLDETATQKELMRMLGGFRTGSQRVVRPRMQYPLRDCWTSTYVQRNWRTNGVSVSLGGFWPYGTEGNIQMQLACTVLKAELDKALAADGMYSVVSGQADLLPAEKLAIHVHCEPVAPYGLPADVTPALPVQALATVRSVINRLAREELSPEQLSRCKTVLGNRLKAEESTTQFVRNGVLNRQSVGRDVHTGYAQRLKAVSAADLRSLFEQLTHTDCEYIVQ